MRHLVAIQSVLPLRSDVAIGLLATVITRAFYSAGKIPRQLKGAFTPTGLPIGPEVGGGILVVRG